MYGMWCSLLHLFILSKSSSPVPGDSWTELIDWCCRNSDWNWSATNGTRTIGLTIRIVYSSFLPWYSLLVRCLIPFFLILEYSNQENVQWHLFVVHARKLPRINQHDHLLVVYRVLLSACGSLAHTCTWVLPTQYVCEEEHIENARRSETHVWSFGKRGKKPSKKASRRREMDEWTTRWETNEQDLIESNASSIQVRFTDTQSEWTWRSLEGCLERKKIRSIKTSSQSIEI